MGFWHTGYMDHHEERGLPAAAFVEPSPILFPCDLCERKFPTEAEFREHRFQDHPLPQPALLYRGVPLGHGLHVFKVPLKLSDLEMINVSRAKVGDTCMRTAEAIARLVSMRQGALQLTLKGATSDRVIEFQFDVPDANDLTGVVTELQAVIGRRRLDHEMIGEFIAATSRFPSARRLSAAIVDYFFGVIAKEGKSEAGDGIDYREKWNCALDRLSDMRHPIAIEIRSIINLHFNQFTESARAPAGRKVSAVARRFGEILGLQFDHASSAWDGFGEMFLDRDTSQICAWAAKETFSRSVEIEDMERFIRSQSPALDKVKVRVLLAGHYARIGDRRRAEPHLQAMIHDDTGFGRWALQLSRQLEGI